MGFVEDETPWCGGHVSARVRCVRANNPSPMTYVGTNSWIVAEPGAKECVVIDPAPAGEQIQRILATCVEAGLRIGAIVATHDHPDHIEGIPELVAATGAPVYAPRTSRIEQLLQKYASAKRVGAKCARSEGAEDAGAVEVAATAESDSGGSPHSCEEKAGWGAGVQILHEGSFRPFEGAPEFEAIALPGHSEDSVGLLLPAEQSLFTGDVLFRHGPTVVFHPDGVLASYFASLDTLEQLVREGRVQRFYPGHGYPIDDPLPIIEATRKHRVDRLDQVKEALNAGTPAEPDALFDVVYRGVNPALRMPSIRSIRAQLKYLGI